MADDKRADLVATTATLSAVLGTAALRAGAPEAAPEYFPVVLDIAGRRVELGADEAVRLRDAAAARADTSSAARDLSLLLDRALHHRRMLALRRAEAQVLRQLASDVGLLALAREIAAAA
jgi:hypothetical protein